MRTLLVMLMVWLAVADVRGEEGETQTATNAVEDIDLATTNTNYYAVDSVTNAIWYHSVVSVASNYLVTNVSDQALMELVKDGTVCRVIGGHRWEFGCGKDGCTASHQEPMYHCGVCGKVAEERERRGK